MWECIKMVDMVQCNMVHGLLYVDVISCVITIDPGDGAAAAELLTRERPAQHRGPGPRWGV